MNCRRFQNCVHEYMDGALSAREQGAVERHRARCGACQRTLLREQQVAQVLSRRFRHDTELLAIRPDLWRLVLEKVEQRQHRWTLLESAGEFWVRWAWPMVISGSLLVLIGLTVYRPFPAAHAREREAANATTDTYPSAVSSRV